MQPTQVYINKYFRIQSKVENDDARIWVSLSCTFLNLVLVFGPSGEKHSPYSKHFTVHCCSPKRFCPYLVCWCSVHTEQWRFSPGEDLTHSYFLEAVNTFFKSTEFLKGSVRHSETRLRNSFAPCVFYLSPQKKKWATAITNDLPPVCSLNLNDGSSGSVAVGFLWHFGSTP